MHRPPEPSPARLHIASYNVFKGNYLDRRGPRGGTLRDDVSSLASLRAADVLLLQEAVIVGAAPGRPGRDTVAALAAAWVGAAALGGGSGVGSQTANGAAAEATSVAFAGSPAGHGRWGVAAICRHPARFESLQLPRPFWSPWQRAALGAEIGDWLVVTVHLEVWPIGAPARRKQMAAVLDFVNTAAPEGRRPVIVAGDLNCERGAPHDALVGAGFRPAIDSGPPTFEFAGLRLRLDHIYVRGASVEGAGVERAARGSDHRPVWAVLRADGAAANVDTGSSIPL